VDPHAGALHVVGQRVPRVDGPGKATGASRYADDLSFPRMLFARLARSPVAHAQVIGVRDAVARGVPGVAAILSAANADEYFADRPSYDPAGHDSDRAEPFHPLPGDASLFGDVVRYVGEPVAVVGAETDTAALRAASLVEIDVAELAAVCDPEQALEPGAPAIHNGAPGNVAAVTERRRGDVDAGLGDAAVVIERRFTTSKQKQAQLEPTCCVAVPSAAGGVTVWSPSQAPHRARRTLAHLFGLDLTRVRVVNPVIGGAFGKGDALTAEPYAVALALMTGRSVKLRFSRNEDFVGTESRHPAIASLTAGFAPDGSISALRARVILDAGAYLSHSPRIAAVLANQLFSVYPIPNADIKVTVVFTNTPVSGAFRGYGGPQAAFALEQLVDLGAEAVGIDPLSARATMLRRARSGPESVGSREALLECIERGGRAIGWDTARSRPRDQGQIRRGVGMACVTWKSGVATVPGSVDRSGASVQVNPDGSVDVLTAACDLGTGLTTALAQVAAEVLKVPVRSVLVSTPDTAVTPFDSGAFASRSLYRAGQAVHQAAMNARAKVMAYAAELLEASPADLDLTAERVVVRGAPARGLDVPYLLHRGLLEGRDFRGHADAPLTGAPVAAAQFAEVDVDTETGQVTVTKLVAVQDVGQAINPQIVEGQIQGAAYQGLGYALLEDLVIDRSTGAALTGSFMDYRVPTAVDGPTVTPIIVEHPDPTGPFGAKGVGEPSIILTAPAVANAIYHATGVRVTSLPITPERLYNAARTQQGAPPR
jgi:xanthine dehydrogenase molybdenum-binding subunit